MPSKSPAQARLMAAAAHTPGGYDGVPQSVGRDFNQADKGGKLLQKAVAHRLRRGKRAFHKEPDADEKGGPSDMDKDNA